MSMRSFSMLNLGSLDSSFLGVSWIAGTTGVEGKGLTNPSISKLGCGWVAGVLLFLVKASVTVESQGTFCACRVCNRSGTSCDPQFQARAAITMKEQRIEIRAAVQKRLDMYRCGKRGEVDGIGLCCGRSVLEGRDRDRKNIAKHAKERER